MAWWRHLRAGWLRRGARPLDYDASGGRSGPSTETAVSSGRRPDERIVPLPRPTVLPLATGGVVGSSVPLRGESGCEMTPAVVHYTSAPCGAPASIDVSQHWVNVTCARCRLIGGVLTDAAAVQSVSDAARRYATGGLPTFRSEQDPQWMERGRTLPPPVVHTFREPGPEPEPLPTRSYSYVGGPNRRGPGRPPRADTRDFDPGPLDGDPAYDQPDDIR
jgi:hypothetical protein